MKNKWLRFDINKENIFGLVCGLIMVLVSIAKNQALPVSMFHCFVKFQLSLLT